MGIEELLRLNVLTENPLKKSDHTHSLNPFATIRACAVEYPIGQATPPFWPRDVCGHSHTQLAKPRGLTVCMETPLEGMSVENNPQP